MRSAIYPGTYDPVTYGHLDIVQRATGVFDEVIVAVAADNNKNPLFSLEERINLFTEATADMPRVSIKPFRGLTVDFARHCGSGAIIRGLRAMSDFEYEFQLALMNKKLAPDIETVFLMTRSDFSIISSSAIKTVASLRGNVSEFVPEHVERALMEKYKKRRHK
ncbi:MAG TPA: pantetheine-phosphate adenylyltransferase [Desulfitobacteriaceae bacterium]|nr:pantetheine-phosphate adenylyltransferase [Desulfitobacteriaceae bacterium]